MAGTLTAKTTCILVLTLSYLATTFSQTEPCNSCCQGQSGIPGIPGTAGSSGAPGNNGSPGNNGLPGRDGLKGEAGFGIKGDSGEVGPPSERGFPGPQGPSGQIGGPGPRGLQGLPGKVGPNGRGGAPGTVGQSGPVGEKGSKGEAPMNQQPQSAFTVIKTSTQTLTGNQAMVFQVVETNIGNHYDSSSHKFTCQIPGTYFFTFTIASNSYAHNPWVQLTKDGTQVVIAYNYDSNPSNHFMQSTQSAVLQLDTGNQVWLQGSGTVYSHSNRYSSFSGFLLYS